MQFDAAPAVPVDYPRLAALTAEEISAARAAGYVAEKVIPEARVQRAGSPNYSDPPPAEDMSDWRTRMYITWFCYLYENFLVILHPLYAMEELVLEFKGLNMLDPGLASRYAGAGGAEPASSAMRIQQLDRLRPLYIKARALLDAWVTSTRG